MKNKVDKEKVVCIISGGIDSTTLIYDLKSRGYDIHALSFDYNQKHKRELECAKKTCEKLNIPHKILDLKILNEIAPSALTRTDWKVPEGHYADENMKQTVVPFRNLVMLSLASSFAGGIGAKKLFYGAHSGDHCLPEGTKILTDKGLENIEHLRVGETIYSYNVETGVVEDDKVLKIIEKGAQEEILQISTTTGEEILCTSEHKIYRHLLLGFDRHYGWAREIEIVPANQLEKNDYIFVYKNSSRNFKNNSRYKTLSLFKELLPNENFIKTNNTVFIKSPFHALKAVNINHFEDFIKICAWYLAEGYTTKCNSKRSSRYMSGISQSAKHNLSYTLEITELLKNLQGEVRCNHSADFSGTVKEVTFNISGTLSALLQTCGKYSRDKKIPEPIMKILTENEELRSIFLETIIKGDGHIPSIPKYTSTHIQYSTISIPLKEQLVFLFRLSGLKVAVGKGTISLSEEGRKSCANTYKNLYFCRIKNIQKIKNNKKVYDIEVEKNHNFFAGEYGGYLVSNSIYPDCRPEFIESLTKTIKLGDWSEVELEAPYGNIDKGDIAILGKRFGVDYSLTWTCYNPQENLACGKCGACTERLEAFKKAGIIDPIKYKLKNEVPLNKFWSDKK